MSNSPYSYRTDPAVPPFDDRYPIVIFDGTCVLCSTGVQWILRRDPNGNSRFAAIQGPIPQGIYQHFGLDADAFDTFMVLSEGIAYTKWQGVVAAGRAMPAPWRWLASMMSIVPNSLGNKVYDWVQRNRIGWFGRRDNCLLPDALNRHRFI